MAWDRLTESEQSRLSALRREPDFYGVLLPKDGGGTIKAVDRQTALLLLTLDAPGPLPFFVHEAPDPRAVSASIRGLVLDGVLELEHGGRFVSGVEALARLGLGRDPGLDDGRSRLAALSYRALRWALSLPTDFGSRRLALRLYAYNSLPVEEPWRGLRDRSAIEGWLGLGARGGIPGGGIPGGGIPGGEIPSGDAEGPLRRYWRPLGNDRASGWISFRGRGADDGEPAEKGRFKLYMSPLPEALPSVMPILLERLGPRARGFKIGADAVGLSRPDKCVAYFDQRDDLVRSADELRTALEGVPAQGVPFTADIDPHGLLSWGMDPPTDASPLPWQQRESWRWWLVRRWVAALDAARGLARSGREKEAEASDPEASDPDALLVYTLERLRLRGVDVERWLPSAC